MPSATAVANTSTSSHAPGVSPAGEDVCDLFARWQGERDQAAREELVRRFMPLARSLARRYGNRLSRSRTSCRSPRLGC